MKPKRTVKLDFRDLLPIGITFAVLGIALSYGADVTADVGATHAAGTVARNVSDNSLAAQDDLADNLTTIVGVLIAAIIIGILLRNFFLGGR